MRTLSHLMIILLLISFSVTSCKKEYPSNTPKWLKTKIKEAKKEMKEEAKYGEPFHRIVQEISNGTETDYLFKTEYLPNNGLLIVYSKDGEILCSARDTDSVNCSQYYPNFMTLYKVVRTIWDPN
jgi:hypothetical protein